MSDNSIRTEYDSLRADFSQMRSDLAGLTKAIGEMTSAEASGASKAVRRQFNQAVDGAEALGHSGASAIEQQITEHPLAVMALAFGLGLVIGRVAHRS